MSGHIIYVWDAKHGLPQSFQDAVTIFQKIENLNEQPSLPMLRFAERMQNIVRLRLETREELNNNREFQEWFYDIKQEMREHKQAVFAIHIPVENDLEIMKLVIKVATDAELVAFDDRYAMVFLPSGQIWPIESARIFEDVLEIHEQEQELPKDEMAFAAWIEPYVSQMLLKEGFILTGPPKKQKEDINTWVSHIYSKAIEIGHQEIVVTYSRNREFSRGPYDGGYHVSLSIEIYVPTVFSIYELCGFLLAERMGRIRPAFTISGPTFTKSEVIPKGHTHREQLGFKAIYTQKDILDRLAFYEQIATPYIHLTQNIKGLDKAVNDNLPSIWGNYNYTRHNAGLETPRCLIVARLANNPHFEELAIKLANPKYLMANESVYASAWPQLVDYLRDDINPETFWQQYAELKIEENWLEQKRVKILQEQFRPKTDEELMSLASQWHDTNTGLIWQRCCIGQHWQNGDSTGDAKLLSWKEVLKLLEQLKDTSWRLPSLEELKTLTLSKKVGYVTKNGFDFYEKIQTSFAQWITPSPDISVATVMHGARRIIDTLQNDANLKGYVRLVKSAS